MAKTTAPVPDAEPLAHIDEHPLVQPLAETRLRLKASQTKLNDELLGVRKSLIAESDASSQPVPPWSLRQARQRAELLQEELDEVHVALFASTEALEAARSEARAELRPVLKQEAVQVLKVLLRRTEELQEAQEALQALDTKARHLGITLTPAGCMDRYLPSRLGVIRQVLARLQD